MKVSRQAKILELIANKDIETQEELAMELRESGFNVTQATVSRDIRQMKLTKILSKNGYKKYCTMTNSDLEISERLVRVFKEAVIKMDYSQNMVVIKTLDGMGMAVGVALDNMNTDAILGTIAGDDTVFCVTRSNHHAGVIVEELYRVIRTVK